MSLRIALISCTKSKTSYPAPARLLYSKSDLFRKALAYVEPYADHVYVLSALYGLVALDQPLEPYELTLKTMPARERKRWAERVFSQIQQRHGANLTGYTFEFHAGEKYREHLAGLVTGAGAKCTYPTEGLTFGRQLQFYGGGAPATPTRPKTPPAHAVREQAPAALAPQQTGFAEVWARIVARAGQPFYQIRGGQFHYQVVGGRTLRLDRTRQNIPYSELEKAHALVPLASTAKVQHLRAPSYLFAILMDPRIRQSDW